MLLFNIYFAKDNPSLADKFIDTGFKVCEQITTNNDNLVFDVAWLDRDCNILNMHPVRLVITENKNIIMPSQYHCSVCRIDDWEIFIYSFSERPFVLQQDWQNIYQQFLHEENFAIKIFADHVYRYLLAEKIQEVEDWCGHMSSVVGKF